MSEPGLQVTIKYNSLKFNHSDGRPRDEVSIVMNDLRLLRVHAPSRKNILREGKTGFTLLWPLARKDPKIPNNTLYSRWIKLSRHDLEESVQLRKSFMIESITVIEGGRLASSTGKWDPQPQTGASGVPAAGDVLVRLQPPFKHVFVPKRPTHNLRKKLKSAATRQVCTTRNTSLQSSNTMEPPTSRKRRSDEEDMSRSPRRRKLDDSASISSRRSPEHEAGHSSSECSSGIYPASTDRSESTLRPHSDPPASPRTDCHAGEDQICNGATSIVSSDEDHIANLTHEAWGIREKMMALGDRDESIRRELCGLNKVPPLDPVSLSNSEHVQVLESRLAQMEAELQEERERRIRAERALEDVERECRSPFVVPALFRAFMTISEFPI